MGKKFNPREVIGKRYKCDTKQGKKCVPKAPDKTSSFGFSHDEISGLGRCIYCNARLNKRRS